MNLMVTGAAGFIGSRLCQKADKFGFNVKKVFRTGAESDGIIVGNIDSKTQWSWCLKDTDCVVHLANRAHVTAQTGQRELSSCFEINTYGTLNLALQAAKSGVRRFVFISSVGVNGRRSVSPFTESDIPRPQEDYAISKLEAEKGLEKISRETGMEMVIIRPPLVYGPGAPGNFGKLVKAVKHGIPLPLKLIDNKRSLAALENVTDFIFCCLAHPKAANELFLISDDYDVSTPELLIKVGRALRKKVLLLPLPVSVIKLGARLAGKSELVDKLTDSLQVDCSKAKTVLGWKPKISMDAQLEKMLKN